MFNKFFKYTPTLQEQQFIDIVTKLLEHPKTSLRMAPISHKYYLSNTAKHYEIMIRDNGIQITNSKFFCAKIIHPKAFNMLVDLIEGAMEIDRQKSEDVIFKNETRMLEAVINNL